MARLLQVLASGLILTACAGTMSAGVEIDTEAFSAYFTYQSNPETGNPIIGMTGPGLANMRGANFRMEQFDAAGTSLGAENGTIPEEGPWLLEVSPSADRVEYTISQGTAHNMLLGPLSSPRSEGRTMGLYQVVRLDLGQDTAAEGYAMDVWALGLDDALDVGRRVADAVLQDEAPATLATLHYWYAVERIANGFAISTAQWDDSIDQFSLEFNQFYADESTAALSSVAGWSAATAVVGLEALNVPTGPGQTVVNDIRIDVDKTSIAQVFTTTL